MRPCGPFVGAPSTAARIAFIVFPFRLVLGVEPCILSADAIVPAERIGDDLLACACLGLCSLGEALLVEVADRDFGLAGEDALDLRLPAEVRMPEERIVALHCGEVVAPRIAVALRIELLGVIDVDDAVRLRRILGVGCAALVPDAVVLHVRHLAAHDVGREVPGETVVERRLPRKDRALPALGVLRRHVASAQEAEFLLEQVLALVHEREHGAFSGIVNASLRTEVDRRVERVGHSLVAEGGVELRDASRRHLERKRQRLGRHIVVVDRKLLGLVENGLVDRDETAFVQSLHVERDVAVVRLARLLQDRKLGVDFVVEEIADLLIERIDRLQDALDPAFGKLGRTPVGPLRSDERLHGGIERTVAAPDIVIGKSEHSGITNGDPVKHRNARLPAASGKREPCAFVFHAGSGAVLRLAVLPLELPVLRTSAEIGGVLHVNLLVERVVALHHMQEAIVEFRLDLDDGHRNDVTCCDHIEVRRVVEDERHVACATTSRCQGHLVERRRVIRKLVGLATHGLNALHPVFVLCARQEFRIQHDSLRPLVHHIEERERVVAVGNVLTRQLQFARIVVRPVVERRRIPLEAVAEKRRQVGELALGRLRIAVIADIRGNLDECTAAAHFGIDKTYRSIGRNRHRLLVEDLRRKLSADRRQSVLRLVKRIVHVELRHIERPVDDIRVVDTRADWIGRRTGRIQTAQIAIHIQHQPTFVTLSIICHPRNDFALGMRRAVRPVECSLIRIGKLEDIVRGTAVISGLMRPVPTLAVLEALGGIAVKRSRHELLKV